MGSDRYFPTRRNSSNETKHQTLLEQNDTFQQDETARRVFVCVDRLVLSNEAKHQTLLEQKDTFQQDKTARRCCCFVFCCCFLIDRYFPTRRNSSNETKHQTLLGQKDTFQQDETARRFADKTVRSSETKQRDVLAMLQT